MQTVINTERLTLRAMHQDDLARLTDISTNPIVMAQFQPQFRTPERSKLMLNKIINQQTTKGYSLYGVIHKKDNLLIGFCGFLDNETDDGQKFVELGYRFDNAYWKQGYASEAAIACRDYAFNDLNIQRLCSIILEDNLPSIAVAKKVGMKQVDEVLYHGDRCLLFEITKD